MGKLIETHLIMGFVCEGHTRIYNWGHKLYIFQLLKILGILCSKIDPNDMKPIRKYHVIVFSCKGYLAFLLRCLRAL